MKQTLKLSFEMTDVLSRIEHNGLKINLDTLDQIEKEYEELEFDDYSEVDYDLDYTHSV